MLQARHVLLTMLAVLFIALSGTLAAAADIEPLVYNKTTGELLNPNPGYTSDANWTTVLNAEMAAVYQTVSVYQGFDNSTHPQGTFNSPYTAGIDGYNYNDPQDYTDDNGYGGRLVGGVYTAGPHGGYMLTTHKCRECHAVHRAAGRFKLTRANSRFESCDWCHGMGAGSGQNIQTDNDDNFTREYNVGHTMGFGIQNGKWKAPDDTYPAYTPPYWLGGFSCFDCHSPHANPSRILGFSNAGVYVAPIANPGHEITQDDLTEGNLIDANRPVWLGGSWLLIKDPDQEINTGSSSVSVTGSGGYSATVAPGGEISDLADGDINLFSATTAYPVNKMQTDWAVPIGLNAYTTAARSDTAVFTLSEFCGDCHDGNTGISTRAVPLFSEDRALYTGGTPTDDWRGNYDIGYAHDMQTRQCGRQMVFNPEDDVNFGPQCRMCHKGSSDCSVCHSSDNLERVIPSNGWARQAYTTNQATAADNTPGVTGWGNPGNLPGTGSGSYNVDAQGKGTPYGYPTGSNSLNFSMYQSTYSAYNVNGLAGGGVGQNGVPSAANNGIFKWERTVVFDSDWRTSASEYTRLTAPLYCSNDGFSFPHRTLGWKMLKDDLFGVDFLGQPVGVGENRPLPAVDLTAHTLSVNSSGQYVGYDVTQKYVNWLAVSGLNKPAHDLDSVCLDCHNPTIWNATSPSHVDDPSTEADNYNDDLLLRGLP